jgi:HKD family nuclease
MDFSNTKRTQQQKVDFLHELIHRYEYGLIATFNLDPQFLEEYLLSKVGAFSGCSYLTILMDATQYEILSSSRDQQLKQLNRRYLLVPIQVPGSFHAKVYIFASKKTGLLILGSANLTRAGLTRNAELVYTYRYDQDKDKKNLNPLFQQAFSFFVELQKRGLAHSKALEENIERMANEVPWLREGLDLSLEPKPFRFIHNLEKPIIRQLVTDPSFTPIEAHFLSPFFDQSPNLIERLCKASGAQSLSFYTQNGTTTLNPEWISSTQGKAANAKFYLVEYVDDERLQNLHGKAILLTDKALFALYYGSANCTSQGLFTSSESGNIETGLLLLGNTKELGDLRRLFVTGDNRITPLTSADDLHISTERESPEPSPKHLITIWEAEIDGNKLHIRTSALLEVEAKELIVVVEREENDFYSLSPDVYEGETIKVKCSGNVLNWLNTQTCVVYLGSNKSGNIKVLSNRVFVVNLSDPETGRNLRESRLLRDARLGYRAFLGVIDRLAGDEEDLDQLIKFLTLCEIPFNERFSPFGLGHERVFNPPYSEELRTLGRRAINLFQSVHQAAIYFIDRHQKRLEKHVTNGSMCMVMQKGTI